MAIHARFEQGIVVLSGVGRLMNDPRHFDAGKDVRDLVDQGYRGFVLEVGGVKETGSTVLGLMTTLSRLVRNAQGELVLANVSPSMESFIESMRMDSYWDLFDDVGSAVTFLSRSKFGRPRTDEPTSLTKPRIDSR